MKAQENRQAQKKEVVFLVWNNKQSGGKAQNLKYAKAFFEAGYFVRVVFIFGMPKKPSGHLNFLSFWRYFWEFNKADVLIVTFWPTAYLSFLLKAKRKIYLVSGWEANFHRFFLPSFLAKFSLKLPFDEFFTISIFLKKKLKQLNKKKEIFLVPYFIETDIFCFFKNKFEKKRKKIRVLSVVSNYNYAKNMPGLVKVVKFLKERKPCFSFTLISFEKDVYDQCFDQFISNPSLRNLAKQYQKADLFLNTSLIEGFFLPGLEAMACGCPVVMTNSGGVEEYAKDNYNCLLGKSADEIIKKRLVEKIIDNQELQKRLVANGLKTARQFSKQEAIKKFKKLLNEGSH